MRKLNYTVKLFTILLLQIILMSFAEAQRIECKDDHGNAINLDTYLYFWETYHFSLYNHLPANWKIFAIGQYGNPIEIKNAHHAESVNMDIEESSLRWSLCKRFYNSTVDTCYYKGFVTSEEDKKKDTVYVKLTYVPSKPIIKDISLDYDSYDYTIHYLVEPKFTCTIHIPYADNIDILYTPFGGNLDPDVFFSADERLGLLPIDGDFVITNKDCDANQKICFYGYCKYGWSINSDTILINDLIKDSNILNDLNQTAGINSPNDNVNDILKFCSGAIYIKSNLIKELVVYDSFGNLVLNVCNPSIGNKIYMKNGVYVVKMKMENKCLTKKIFL